MPSKLYTLEGAWEFSETIVFCAPVKNENNLPRLAEILKAFEGFPSPLGKLCLISWWNNVGIFFPGFVPSWVRSRARYFDRWQVWSWVFRSVGDPRVTTKATLGLWSKAMSAGSARRPPRHQPGPGEPQCPESSQSHRPDLAWSPLYSFSAAVVAALERLWWVTVLNQGPGSPANVWVTSRVTRAPGLTGRRWGQGPSSPAFEPLLWPLPPF